MNEKAQEEDEFEDDEVEEIASGDDVDVDHLFRDLEKRKRNGPKIGDPAWRKLERIREEQRTAELVSDFDDYDIGDMSEDEPRAAAGRARPRHVS
jgi:hypothetical protein